MKRAYMKPATQVVKIQQQNFICNSKVDVINPGQDNQPAGARSHDGWDDEEARDEQSRF